MDNREKRPAVIILLIAAVASVLGYFGLRSGEKRVDALESGSVPVPERDDGSQTPKPGSPPVEVEVPSKRTSAQTTDESAQEQFEKLEGGVVVNIHYTQLDNLRLKKADSGKDVLILVEVEGKNKKEEKVTEIAEIKLEDGSVPANVDVVITGIPPIPHIFDGQNILVNIIRDGEARNLDPNGKTSVLVGNYLDDFQESLEGLLNYAPAMEMLQDPRIVSSSDWRGLDRFNILDSLEELGLISVIEPGNIMHVNNERRFIGSLVNALGYLDALPPVIASDPIHPERTERPGSEITGAKNIGVADTLVSLRFY